MFILYLHVLGTRVSQRSVTVTNAEDNPLIEKKGLICPTGWDISVLESPRFFLRHDRSPWQEAKQKESWRGCGPTISFKGVFPIARRPPTRPHLSKVLPHSTQPRLEMKPSLEHTGLWVLVPILTMAASKNHDWMLTSTPYLQLGVDSATSLLAHCASLCRESVLGKYDREIRLESAALVSWRQRQRTHTMWTTKHVCGRHKEALAHFTGRGMLEKDIASCLGDKKNLNGRNKL